MSGFSSTGTARIRALKTSLISLLEGGGDEEVATEKLEEGAEFLTEAYQDILNEGSKQLVAGTLEGFAKTMGHIEDAYRGWRAVDAAFTDALSQAYEEEGPGENLGLDSIYADLRARIGEPIAALYARLHSEWNEHVRSRPWDAYAVQSSSHIDSEIVAENVQLLVHGDHLDVEDALERLTGPQRYAFAEYLEHESASVELLEESLWMRPEIVVMNDYWRPNSQVRLVDVLLRRGDDKSTGAFASVRRFFDTSGRAESIASSVQEIWHEDREPYLRCLMLHPDQAVRRYAASGVDIESFWKVVTPNAVPCATILSMLEKVVASTTYDSHKQKVFFDAVYRRLLNLTSRSDVLYARGIIRIFAELPFLMEDAYFQKLERLIDYVGIKERRYGINDGVLAQYADELRRQKHTIGNLDSEELNVTSIPPVVLRKLARDGHHWYELAMHPMFKIARETIRHIHSPDRALRIANNRVVNQDVLRAVGRNRSLFTTLPAKMALLSNPRTPPQVSMGYILDLSRRDIELLLSKSTIHPELRLQLRHRLQS